MTEEKHTFDALENIRHWCEALAGAYVPKAVDAGLLALLVELECAIGKYGQMAKRFVGMLPKNVTADEFEFWSDWLHNGVPGFGTLFQVGVMDERIAGDEDLARLSMNHEDLGSIPEANWKRFVTSGRLDNEVTCSILRKISLSSSGDRQWEVSRVSGALDGVEGLHHVVSALIADKMEILKYTIRDIIYQLECPSDRALRNVLLHYWQPYTADKQMGREHIKLEVHRFFHDHRSHRNYRTLLEREAEKAKDRLLQCLGQWDINPENLIQDDEREAVMIDEREAGLAIYRRVADLSRDPGLMKELYECFGLFIKWRMYRMEALRMDSGRILPSAAPANKESLRPQSVEKASVPSEPWKNIFCNPLKNHAGAFDRLKQILRTVCPEINKGSGKKHERKNWIHLYHAWLKTGLLKNNCIPQSFAEAINAICPNRTVGSITKTFSDKPWDEKHLTDSDRERIAELEALFRPVRERLDGSDARAGSPER